MTNTGIAEAWNALARVIWETPEKAAARYDRATATLDHGLKCIVRGPRGEQIETDMPPLLGGGGSGPNPGWFFRASLAACYSTVIAAQAARSEINLTILEVTIEGEGDLRGMLGLDDRISAGHSEIRTSVTIGSENGSPDQLRDLVEWAIAHSPVGSTIGHTTPNRLAITNR